MELFSDNSEFATLLCFDRVREHERDHEQDRVFKRGLVRELEHEPKRVAYPDNDHFSDGYSVCYRDRFS